MKRNLLFSYFLVITFSVMAQSALKPELYKSARRSFERKQYVQALGSFAEFKGANEDYLRRHPSLNSAITSAINICEEKIAEKQVNQNGETQNSGGGIRRSSLQVRAGSGKPKPTPVYLLPADSVIGEESMKNLLPHLDNLDKRPFSGVKFTCLTNFSLDSLEQAEYALKRVTIFNELFREKNIPDDRIVWDVAYVSNDENRLKHCMGNESPIQGSLCLDVKFIRRMDQFELEP